MLSSNSGRTMAFVQNVLIQAEGAHGSIQLSIKVLAGQLLLTSDYASALFGDALGIHFREYLRALRVLYVAGQLTSGSALITSIANQTGHTSVSNLAREFRSQTGLSPSEFRSQWRKCIPPKPQSKIGMCRDFEC
jgi:AraC-like DNA-binding protein